MKPLISLFAFLLCLPVCSYASNKEDDKPKMAVVPPTIRFQQSSSKEDAQINPSQIMEQVIPRVAKDAKGRKWPFSILPSNTVESVYEKVAGTPLSPFQQPHFPVLKALAEKVGARYILLIAVKELISFRKDNFFTGERLRARANLELTVYDHDSNSFVWKATNWAETNHPNKVIGNVGMQREQDGALNAALTKGLEPFAKGQRMVVERTGPNMVAMVDRVLGDGKKVLLNVGRSQDISVGDVFHSIESDSELSVQEVLDNGCIALVTSGIPKEKEAFKLKAN